MGRNFSLLQQLTLEKDKVLEQSPLPPGIKYQEYTLEVNGEESTVFIPLRESAAFERTLSAQTKYLDGDALREILRKHRGIKHKGT